MATQFKYKLFGKQSRLILLRKPLLSESLLALIEPLDRFQYRRIELDPETHVSEFPPPFWSQDLQRLFEAVSYEEWTELDKDKASAISELERLRNAMFPYFNREQRLLICDELEIVDRHCIALYTLRLRYLLSIADITGRTPEKGHSALRTAERGHRELSKIELAHIEDVISSHAAACTAHDVAKFSAVSQMSQTSLASNSTESSLLQGIPVNHFHDHNSKYISKEALAILNRGPLLSPMLLSLLEPHRENYVDTEFQKTLTRPPPLPTVWSRELDRLYHSLTEEDWMVLVDEEGRVITLLQVARFPMFGFSKNTKKRLDLCEAIDRVDAGFTVLRRLRFRYVQDKLNKKRSTIEEEMEVCKDVEGVGPDLGEEEIARIEDVITAHANARGVALTPSMAHLPKIQPPSAQSDRQSLRMSMKSVNELDSDLALATGFNKLVGSTSAFTTDNVALAGPHLRNRFARGSCQESLTSTLVDCEEWIRL